MAKNNAPMYSGSGQLGSSIIIFVICMALFLGGLYVLGTYPESGPWIFCSSIIFFGLAYLIPMSLISSKTNNNIKGGSEQGML